ncbi:uncharacterized protein LOC126674009 [Mercurialis annua]|uniref:uncharacterized protein LOC126674009 n=1 Tax=Mercurialis annua TaxID=3986 RepID=UPI00215EE8C6|nr:uncharacterized protein LOC126674009 [Mercurialis annua]
MLGTGLQFSGRGRTGDDRFYRSGNGRRSFNNHHYKNQHNDQLRRAQSDVTPATVATQSPTRVEKSEKSAFLDREAGNLTDSAKPVVEPVVSPLSNLERFLESITPSVPAQYLSKTTVRGWRTCDVEYQPYFELSDLWDSFKEWSAYGAGVPVILNDSDSVVQYYVPYLSGIQIYGESMKTCVKSRRHEDSDSDFRDSSSDGSSDCEPERGLKGSREQWNHHHLRNEVPVRMNGLSLRDHQEDFSSDDGESNSSEGCLLFEYLERDLPYSREPLADKISDLALRFPGLKTLRSYDLLPSSWISLAWYPIYRIPTGPTLKDLEACFLTYHSLHTPLGGAQTAQSPVLTYPSEMDGVPKLSLPVFGLASYKFKAPLWTPSGGSERQLAYSLLQAADNWLRLIQVNHPDFVFFCRR